MVKFTDRWFAVSFFVLFLLFSAHSEGIRKKEFQLITFDLFAALMDVDSSLYPTVVEVVGKDKADAFVGAWYNQLYGNLLISSSIVPGEGYLVDYRTNLFQAITYAIKSLGLNVSSEDQQKLVKIWFTGLIPWKDTASALSQIKSKGYQIAVLSNGGVAQIQSLVKVLEKQNVTFDHIFGSDLAQAYKPSTKFYALPLNITGLPMSAIAHVPGSMFDAFGAKLFGYTTLWCNRGDDYFIPVDGNPNHVPDQIFANLLEVANYL